MKNNLKKILFPERGPFRFEQEEALKNLDVPEFEDFVKLVLALPEEQFYQRALQDDPVYGRMSSELKAELVAAALDCGATYAQEALASSRDIRALLAENGISYNNPAMPNGGGYVIFAQYVEPDSITVFQDSLDKFLALIRKTRYRDIFTEKAVKELLIAHEYFHYLEFKHEQSIITQTKTMELWRFLGYRHWTTFICLSEMSAMAFAKAYQGFPYSPFILDCLLTYAYNKEMSYSIYLNVFRGDKIIR